MLFTLKYDKLIRVSTWQNRMRSLCSLCSLNNDLNLIITRIDVQVDRDTDQIETEVITVTLATLDGDATEWIHTLPRVGTYMRLFCYHSLYYNFQKFISMKPAVSMKVVFL